MNPKEILKSLNSRLHHYQYDIIKENTVDYVIDFKNLESIDYNTIIKWWDEYNHLFYDVTEFISKNNLDPQKHIGLIRDNFKSYVQYFKSYSGELYDFDDYVYERAIELGSQSVDPDNLEYYNSIHDDFDLDD